MKDEKLTYREAATRLGLSASFLSEITHENEDKRKSPSLDLAINIQEVTGGKVAVYDWPKLAKLGRAFQNSSPSSDAPLTEAS